MSLKVGRDIFAQGTQVNAAGAIKLKADSDISITTALKGTEFESKSQYTSSSMWGLDKKVTMTTVTNPHLRNTLSSWNGASFSARAGRDLSLQGTQVNAGGGIEVIDGHSTVTNGVKVTIFNPNNPGTFLNKNQSSTMFPVN